MAREITCDAELAGIYASMVQCTVYGIQPEMWGKGKVTGPEALRYSRVELPPAAMTQLYFNYILTYSHLFNIP